METLTAEEIQSRLMKERLRVATSQGSLLPIFDHCGDINYEAAKKGFTLKHFFMLRWVFAPYVKNMSPEEVLGLANDFLKEQIRLNEIYENLEKRIAEKKKLGLY